MKDALGHGSNPRGFAGSHLPVWYHGSPTGVPGATGQIHVGSYRAARMALEARIGVPADMRGWDGTREYGKTLLAGTDTLDRWEQQGAYKDGDKYANPYPRSGYNVDAPKNDYYPTRMPTMGRDRTPMTPDMKPAVRAYQIVGSMKNSTTTPYSDAAANRLANAQQTKGNGKNGFYYRNEGEDTGSISAVVPDRRHLVGPYS